MNSGREMKTAVFRYHVTIHRPISAVFAFLAEPQNHVHLQPLVEVVENVQAGVNAQGQRQATYRIVERVPVLGLLRVNVASNCVLRVVREGEQVALEAHAPLGVWVQALFTLQAGGEQTQVIEEVMVKSPGWAAGFVTEQARMAHQRMVQNLKGMLEVV